jgi:hypothetical protein
LTASTDPECGRSSPFHAYSIVKVTGSKRFSSLWVGRRPMRNSLEIPSGFPLLEWSAACMADIYLNWQEVLPWKSRRLALT